ncbi:hypothetical protein PILCRDRAFT_37906, partial [Piloderma croceum F 1598]
QKKTEEKKDDEKKAKISRRLSARVNEFFKPKPKADVATPAKVDELPPKIEQPTPVDPLENPATEAAAPAPVIEDK